MDRTVKKVVGRPKVLVRHGREVTKKKKCTFHMSTKEEIMSLTLQA